MERGKVEVEEMTFPLRTVMIQNLYTHTISSHVLPVELCLMVKITSSNRAWEYSL